MPTPSRLARRTTTGSLVLALAATVGPATDPADATAATRPPGAALVPAAAQLPATTNATTAAAIPVSVTTLASGLTIPWDLTFLPNRSMLFTERPGRLRVRTQARGTWQVSADMGDLFAGSEAGLMGVVADPAFGTNRRFYTCQAYRSGGSAADVRVIRWGLSADERTASRQRVVVSGLPISSGRHTGCRLRFATDGTLRVGTGDATKGSAPQDLSSLGGKTLRVRTDGSIPTDNPFYSRGGNARYIWSYGHRNVQGMALRPWGKTMWSVEHGPGRDDEVNVLVKGGNYGWDPVPEPYNEGVPMTDTIKFPNAVRAVWSSGSPTTATSGAGFLRGAGWGRWEGQLAVAELKASQLRLVLLTPDGRLSRTELLPQLDGTYGRLRAAQIGPDGSLYVTTSNGSNDRVLRVTPTTKPTPAASGVDISAAGGVSVVARGNTTTVFVRGGDNRIYRTYQASPGGVWTGFHQLSGVAGSAPAAVADNYAIHLFVRGTNGRLWHRWAPWSAPTRFTAWQDLGGGLTSAPAAASRANGTFEVVARGADNAIWWRSYRSGWRSWRSIGGALSSAPTAAYDRGTGTVRVQAAATNRMAYETRLAVSTVARGWASLGRPTYSAPAVSTGPNPLTVTRSFDGTPVLSRGGDALATIATLTGPPAFTFRTTGYALAGRGGDNALWVQDGRAGSYRWQRVGGTLR